jgi:transposase-like protein
MRLMTKSVIERMLDAEMDVHLDQQRGRTVPEVVATTAASQASTAGTSVAEAAPDRAEAGSGRNRRNGKSAKTVQGESGRLTITTPRDRNGTFEPLLIPKHERRLAGFDDKVLALYAKGMSTRDIQELVKTLYGVELSATLISSLTDAVDEEVTAWRSRPLEPVWPIVYFDGIVVHVRGTSGRVSQHTIYVALGVNLAGKKELLGLWLAESEGAKFWLQVLTDLKNRGLNDIFITLFDFPAPIRKAISTTNAIESVNSVIRKFTRNRKIYPNEESALKITFMAIREASKKWKMPIRNWKAALNHFAILFENRLPIQSP